MSGYGGAYAGRRALGSKMRSSSRSSGRAIPIPLEPLKEGHRMDPQERLFLEAAEKGDKHTMIRCLQGPNPVNVNCTNILGRSAIQIAVDNENIEIVELLLKQEGVKIGDALLYAIREGVYRIVEMLIDHPSITREMLGSEWAKCKLPGDESSDYSPDISPIILAAHCNQFEILQLLLSRGAKIERPHHLTCSCQKCRREVQEDSLRHSLLRIHTYRALASPAWISLTSSDPVLTAFKLSWELVRLASRENEFKDTYAELADQCKKYSCDLLDQCRSSEEVIAVLNKNNESDSEEEQDVEDVDIEDLTLSRLKLAIKYEQKQFVAHPHCQQLLASIWYAGLPGWRKRSLGAKVLIILILISLMPVMACYYLILPRSRLGKLLRTPFMKFMYHSASFGCFLLLLVLASTNVSAENKGSQARQRQRGPPPTILEWFIVFYVTGFIWAECKQLWEEGLKAYVRQWWNWLDFIMLSLYLCTFSLRIVAYAQSQDPDYGPSRMHRTMWPDADPTLISEGVFAIANVFSFARIIYLFQANPQLGPLQISLGCMLIDIGKFLFIFFLVLTSFACGLNQLYYFYSKDDIIQVDIGGDITNITARADDYNNAFEPLSASYVTLFWSLFGLTQLDTVRKGHMQPFTKLDTSFITLFWSMFGLVALVTLEVKMTCVESFGKILFGAYNVSAKVLLLNMLIAMMSKSFHSIVDHADREWKFARSKLWMGYFDEGSTLPPPFNLIISPKSVFYFIRGFKQMLCECLLSRGTSKPRRKSFDGTIKTNSNISVVGYTNNHVQGGLDHDSVVEASTTSGDERPTYNGDSKSLAPGSDLPKYQDIMRRLVSRYIHQMKKQMRQDGVNEDDLLEIKQDISSLRYELREDRKREAARTTGHIDNLKRDILRSLRSAGLSTHDIGISNHPPPSYSTNHPAIPGKPAPGSMSPTLPHSTSGNFLSTGEIDTLKREIVGGLRCELRDLVREVGPPGGPNPRGSPVNPPALLPPINSELYHTHLYTQL